MLYNNLVGDNIQFPNSKFQRAIWQQLPSILKFNAESLNVTSCEKYDYCIIVGEGGVGDEDSPTRHPWIAIAID
jgi:hypothetical protein